MMRGFTARRSSTSSLHFDSDDGKKLVRNTSAFSTRRRSRARPSSEETSRPMLRLPRLCISIDWLTPLAVTVRIPWLASPR
jgi:hypothetical protein